MRITLSISTLASAAVAALLSMPAALLAQSEEVTFHKDIEPILQRSCQSCHRDGGAGPMPLVTYEQVAPYAGLIEYKTGLRDRAGAMPPWYMEKEYRHSGLQRRSFAERRRAGCNIDLGPFRHS